MRRCAVIILAMVAGVCVLAGCNRDVTGGVVTLALSTQSNPFFVQVREGAETEAAALGVTLRVQDAADDPANQFNQLDNAMAAGSEVVIVNPTDSDAVAPAVKALNRADIPVIAVDRDSSGGTLASFVASDNVAGGRQAADALAAAVGGKGEILILQGIAGSSASRERGEGFRAGLQAYPGIHVVATQTAQFDRTQGLNVATNLLQAHPNVVGIFAENDEMALGALEALGTRTDVAVVGFDGTADGMNAVARGRMAATIAQQPAELGAQAVRQAKKILDGRPADRTVHVNVITVTHKNVKEMQP